MGEQHRWNVETAKSASIKGVEARSKNRVPVDHTISCQLCGVLFCAIRSETKRGKVVIRPAYDRLTCSTEHGYEVVRQRTRERHFTRRLKREPTTCAVCKAVFTPIAITKEGKVKVISARVTCSRECVQERKRSGRSIAAARKIAQQEQEAARQADIDALIESWSVKGEDREWQLRRAAAISAAGW